MKLLDSNIIIYSYQPNFSYLKPLVLDPENAISVISQLEILRFHSITIGEETYCDYVFKVLQTFPIDNTVLSKAIELRKIYKMKLGDSRVKGREKQAYTLKYDSENRMTEAIYSDIGNSGTITGNRYDEKLTYDILAL